MSESVAARRSIRAAWPSADDQGAARARSAWTSLTPGSERSRASRPATTDRKAALLTVAVFELTTMTSVGCRPASPTVAGRRGPRPGWTGWRRPPGRWSSGRAERWRPGRGRPARACPRRPASGAAAGRWRRPGVRSRRQSAPGGAAFAPGWARWRRREQRASSWRLLRPWLAAGRGCCGGGGMASPGKCLGPDYVGIARVGREDLMPGALAPGPRPARAPGPRPALTDLLHCFSFPRPPIPVGADGGQPDPVQALGQTVRMPAASGRHPKVPARWNIAARGALTPRC